MNYRILLIASMMLGLLLNSCNDKPTNPDNKNPIDKDIDGNVLKTVEICDKIWMAENLTVSHYRNGDPIPEVTNPKEWVNLTTGAWCYYDNDSAKGKVFGKLYNWFAVYDPRGLAPEGWHIPSDGEWAKLKNCLGGEFLAGGKLKSTGTLEGGDGFWMEPNTGATNECGFSALPGGCRRTGSGPFSYVGLISYWWSSTGSNESNSWYWSLDFGSAYMFSGSTPVVCGFSVRCIKD